MRRRRRIDSALEAIELEQTRIADELAALRRQVDHLEVPTPAEYQEQLLRTFHAGLARLETAQSQVLHVLTALTEADEGNGSSSAAQPTGAGEQPSDGE